MKAIFGLVLFAAGAFAAPTSAQCSTFDIDSQPDPSGMFQTVSWSVDGSSPMAPTFLVLGETLGTTSVALLDDTLDLGLASPFIVVPVGVTDATGALSASFDLPPDLGLTLYGQSVGFGIDFTSMPPSIQFCESNVDDVGL